MTKRGILVILDGWGMGQVPQADAIAAANTTVFDSLMKNYPNSTLETYGAFVGLPDGQMGNSEVGHLNLGAGRIVYQDLALINKAVKENTLRNNSQLIQLLDYCNGSKKDLHLIGLVSDGGVHSHIDHLKSLIDCAENASVPNIYIHAITDGRDTDPHSGEKFIADLLEFLKHKKAKIVSLMGRYYAMDRDKRWERIQKAYETLVLGKGISFKTPLEAVRASYANSVTDEFILPAVIESTSNSKIKEGDAVLCFNFRTDRLRQLTQVLSQDDFSEFNMKKLSLAFYTMTRYDDDFNNVHVLFEKENLSNTLGEMISRYGGKQYRMAETEKYPHVSFFFSGGREKLFSGESRILIPSPKVATYDLQPEMSAIPLTESVIQVIRETTPDFICINYANVDMVGHTGVFKAVITAAETVDSCLAKLVEAALEKNYFLIILADHGNGEYMINSDGTPNTAHTKNPVPCIFVSSDKALTIKNGKLADIAPTILHLFELPVPKEMTGINIINKISN